MAPADVHDAGLQVACDHTAWSHVAPVKTQSSSDSADAFEHEYRSIQAVSLELSPWEHVPSIMQWSSVSAELSEHHPATVHSCSESAPGNEQLPSATHSSSLKTSSLAEHRPCGVTLHTSSVWAVAFEQVSGFGSYPGSHGVHCKPSALYCPKGHWLQFVAPTGEAGSVPTGQSKHSSPVGLNCPRHTSHLATFGSDPASHWRHWSPVLYRPYPQDVHVVRLRVGSEPTGQPLHTIPSVENWPGSVQLRQPVRAAFSICPGEQPPQLIPSVPYSVEGHRSQPVAATSAFGRLASLQLLHSLPSTE